MEFEELLEKKLCILCHENPIGTGVVCNPCRNDKTRAMDIIDKKIRRIQVKKVEEIYKDFKNGNCIKCHDNPSLESMPYCVECAKIVTFGKKK